MAQCVKYLLSKYEVLSLDPQHPVATRHGSTHLCLGVKDRQIPGRLSGQLVYPQQQAPS